MLCNVNLEDVKCFVMTTCWLEEVVSISLYTENDILTSPNEVKSSLSLHNARHQGVPGAGRQG